ncbi:MAG TPA: tRNA pseudouridine(55) synthase TruB [Pyrinomonadaceae bacterium]|nr:tRNA pseudouridine(55) synthase TruB [Pyrinomonadaceae bacterium]
MDGVLIIDKPAGLTSHDVVARVRRLLHVRRVGHTGTLDPFATGILVVLVGRATRLARFLSSADKEYEAVIRLGYATDTGDSTGQALNNPGSLPKISLNPDQFRSALASLLGEIEQLPPMYSAKKYGGRKLYELARRGEEIERRPVRVTIFSLEARGDESFRYNQDGTVDMAVRVACSSGTYIRTLAESVGEQLGVGAHLAELRRTKAGEFSIAAARSLEQLKEEIDSGSLGTILIPPDAALSRMPFVHLSSVDMERTLNGVAVPIASAYAGNWADEEKVRMRAADGTLLAVGSYDAERRLLHPRVVIATRDLGR